MRQFGRKPQSGGSIIVVILALLLFPIAADIESATYNIVSEQQHRQTMENATIYRNVSFSGDIEELVAQAQAIADLDDTSPPPQPPTQNSVSPTAEPTTQSFSTNSKSPTSGTTFVPTTMAPTTSAPTELPTTDGSVPSDPGAMSSTFQPTAAPSVETTPAPSIGSDKPTLTTTAAPSVETTAAPSIGSVKPTLATAAPSVGTTAAPFADSNRPTLTTAAPSVETTAAPSNISVKPTMALTAAPSDGTSTSSAAESLQPTTDTATSMPSISSEPSVSSNSQVVEGTASFKNTLITCSTLDGYHGLNFISFTYAMEVLNGYRSPLVQQTLEDALNNELASKLLPCKAVDDALAETDVVAIDSLPVDQRDESVFCSPRINVLNNCTVVEGNMKVYFEPEADLDLIKYRVRFAVRNFLNGEVQLPGLADSTYLGPAITVPDGLDDNRQAPDVSASSGLSTRAILIFSFAGVSFAIFMGVALYCRSQRNREDLIPEESKAPTRLQHIVPTDSEETNERSLSPFSSMLPNAYRFEDNMSIILETDDERSQQVSDIVISEHSISEESSVETVSFNTVSFNRSALTATPVLGARRRKDDSTEFV